MAILLPTPITIPPQPQQQADTVWIRALNIAAYKASDPIRVNITVCPMVSATGELLENNQTINIYDLDQACSTDPVLASAVQAVFAAVSKLVADNGLFAPAVTGSADSGSLSTTDSGSLADSGSVSN